MNLIVEGIKEKYGETEDTLYYNLVDVFNQMYSVNGKGADIEIIRCYRVGAYTQQKDRPVVMELKHYADVKFLLKYRKELPSQIYIKEDFPLEIDNRRRTLRPVLRQANMLDEYMGKCKMRYDKLVKHGKSYSVQDLENLLENLWPDTI